MLPMDFSRVGRYLNQPLKTGVPYHVRTEMAFRVHIKKTLVYMTKVLIEMRRSMGGCGLHWNSLEMKRRQLDNYAARGIAMEFQLARRGKDKTGTRQIMLSIIRKLDMMGAKAFAKVLHGFQDTCAEILKRELDKLEVLLQTSKLSLNLRVAELRLSAHSAMENLIAYLATREAVGADFSFDGFWQLLSYAYTVIQDLDRAVYMSSSTRVRALEMFVGLTVCNRIMPGPLAASRRLSSGLSPGPRFSRSKTPSPSPLRYQRAALTPRTTSPQGHRRLSLPSRRVASPVHTPPSSVGRTRRSPFRSTLSPVRPHHK